jgi:hypothetical protein
MTLSKIEHDEQQARLCERDERWFHGKDETGPTDPGLKYVLKCSAFPSVGLYFEHNIGDDQLFTMTEAAAMRFDSAAEARDHATANGIVGVWAVLARDRR